MKQAMTIFVVTLLFVGMPAVVAYALAGSAGSAVVIVVSAGLLLGLTLRSDLVLQRLYRAKQVFSTTAPELVMMSYELADRAGLDRPSVALIDSCQPNGFLTRAPYGQRWTLVLSRSLLEELTRVEAEAALALLVTRRRDEALVRAQMAAVLAGCPAILFSGALLRWPERRPLGQNWFMRAIARFSAPWAAFLVKSIADGWEPFKADWEAASLLGNPLTLTLMLTRLDSMSQQTENKIAECHPATAHLFLVNPLESQGLREKFALQAPVQERIARLNRLSGVGVQ